MVYETQRKAFHKSDFVGQVHKGLAWFGIETLDVFQYLCFGKKHRVLFLIFNSVLFPRFPLSFCINIQ